MTLSRHSHCVLAGSPGGPCPQAPLVSFLQQTAIWESPCLPSPEPVPRVHGKFQTPCSRQEEVLRVSHNPSVSEVLRVSHNPSVSLLFRFRRAKQLSPPGRRVRSGVHTGALLPAHLPLHLHHVQPCEVGTSFLPEQLPRPGPPAPIDLLLSSPPDKALLSRLLAEPGWLVRREKGEAPEQIEPVCQIPWGEASWLSSPASLPVQPPGAEQHAPSSCRGQTAGHRSGQTDHSTTSDKSQPPPHTAVHFPGVRCRPGTGAQKAQAVSGLCAAAPAHLCTSQVLWDSRFWAPPTPRHTSPVALRGSQ